MQFSADLVTFTEEILNRKLSFLCSVVAANAVGVTLSVNSVEMMVFYDIFVSN